jgi:hypothetical protein
VTDHDDRRRDVPDANRNGPTQIGAPQLGGNPAAPDPYAKLQQQFGEITQPEEAEIEAQYGQMEADAWAVETQAFLDGHNDLDCAEAARERAELEREVYHNLRAAVLSCGKPAQFTLDEARRLIKVKIKQDVPDEVMWEVYNRLFEDLGF